MQISGHLDLCGPLLIEGWLYADAWGGENIGLQVYIGGELIGECLADRFRQDLRDAGFGDGSCGFSFSVPEAYGHLDFSMTRLRLLGSPVFLLPDEYTTVVKGKPLELVPGEAGAEAGLVTVDAVGASAVQVSPVGASRARSEAITRRGGSFFRTPTV